LDDLVTRPSWQLKAVRFLAAVVSSEQARCSEQPHWPKDMFQPAAESSALLAGRLFLACLSILRRTARFARLTCSQTCSSTLARDSGVVMRRKESTHMRYVAESCDVLCEPVMIEERESE